PVPTQYCCTRRRCRSGSQRKSQPGAEPMSTQVVGSSVRAALLRGIIGGARRVLDGTWQTSCRRRCSELRAHARARADGDQDSTVSVFTRDDRGTLRHAYSTQPRMANDIDQRGIVLLCPVWHLMDLTPQGRDDW